MTLETLFRYLLNFLYALFSILILYWYYTDEISSFLAWINVLGGYFLRSVLIAFINNED